MDSFIALLIGLFWAAIIAGLIVRFVRAKKGKRLRAVAEPLVSAADSYHENLIGNTGTAELNELTER